MTKNLILAQNGDRAKLPPKFLMNRTIKRHKGNTKAPKDYRPRLIWKMTTSIDQCDRLLSMASIKDYGINDLSVIWPYWDEIASRVIPEGFDLRDCLACVNFDPSYDDQTVSDILERMRYLSDRLDPARCFALDYRIREKLGMPQRELTSCQN